MSGARKKKAGRPVAVRNLHPALRVDRRAVAAAVHLLDENHAALAAAGSTLAGAGELSLAFLTDPALAALHGRFLSDPSATDVITFAGQPALGVAGEICVSADAAIRYAADHGGDLAGELTLYLAHGWLHLAGHDDLSPAPRRAMRRAEARALALLRAAGAIPKFTADKKTRAIRRARG